MRSIAKALSLAVVLSVATACEEDDQGFTGDFNLSVVETEDMCDAVEEGFQSQLAISGTADDLEVRFGEDAVLTGGLNAQNFFEVSGPITSVVEGLDGEPVEVESFMVLIFEVTAQGRRVEVREGSMITFNGTIPKAPGQVCVWEFQGTGQRASLGPVF